MKVVGTKGHLMEKGRTGVTLPGASRKQQLLERFELYLRDEWKAIHARGVGVRWEVLSE